MSVQTPSSHFCRNTLTISQTPSGPSSWWFTMPPWMHLCSELWKSLTPCCPVLTWPSLTGHFSQMKTLHQVRMHKYYWSGLSVICQELLHLCTTFSMPNCVPQTLQTSQATSNSWEPLEFHIHGFHREAPPSFSHTLILVIVDHLSEQSLFIPTHITITSLQLAQLLILHVFSKHGVPSHVTSDCSTELYTTFYSPSDMHRHEASLHFWISCQRWWTNWMN